MKDVFLSYSSKDREKAALIERAFEAAGISVFWDQEVPPGRDWDSWIREHLTGAKVAVVLWSKASVASANVKHEAMIAKETGKLIPVLVEPLSPSDFPMGMYLTQAALLTDFRGGDHPGMAKLIAEIETRLGRRSAEQPSAAGPSRAARSPGAIAAVLAAPLVFLALGALALLNRPTVCAATGVLCTPVAAASLQPAPPAAPSAPAVLDPVEVLQGDWAWTGIPCGQGPHVALDVVDGEKTLIFTYKDTRYRHAIAGVEGRTLKTLVVEPDEVRGTAYRMEITPDGKGVALYEGAQIAPDTWEKCP
ncbi:MAG: TIR domain-containing protein [Alphaproteobacteria bacterium]|nr:TIR domain-containing protein [Alphaproteobacteria bacterium]